MLSFKPTFSLSSFTFIKRLFSSSSFSPIRVVSSVYLSLLIFLLAILIPACASSSPAFLMMYSAYKLNKQGDNIQPWRTPFPICNQSVLPCPVRTVASWPAYRFLKRQVRWSGIHLFQNFPHFIVILVVYKTAPSQQNIFDYLLQIEPYKISFSYTHTHAHTHHYVPFLFYIVSLIPSNDKLCILKHLFSIFLPPPINLHIFVFWFVNLLLYSEV